MVLADVQNKMLEWRKSYSKRAIKVNICANVIAIEKQKDHYGYINTPATIYMTYNPYFYINADLDIVHE